jgi:hypothetical protein
MTKAERKEIIIDLRYELVGGVHTFNQCKCKRHGTRSGRCYECLLDLLETK